MTLAAVAGFWAIFEYRNDLEIQRIKTALELHKYYAKEYSGKLDHLLTREQEITNRSLTLRLRCDYYSEEVAAGRLLETSLKLPNCAHISHDHLNILQSFNSQVTTKQREILRERIVSALSRIQSIDGRWVGGISLFFRSVIICVDRGNCDAETTIGLFAKDMTAFLNSVCPFHDRLSSENRIESEFIALFLLKYKVSKNIYWTKDNGRESLFLCTYLRDLEKKINLGSISHEEYYSYCD
ncbi:MAG: hypothetical protein ABJN26_06145 [Stappiaceae bacterium]